MVWRRWSRSSTTLFRSSAAKRRITRPERRDDGDSQSAIRNPQSSMKVLITLTDVEPAVRLKNLLERSGVETEVVSPYDDLRTAVEKQKPDVILLTGGLVDQPNVQLVKRQLWEGTAVVGLSDLDDPTLRDRLRALGYVEIWTKPVDVNEVFDGIKRILERRRLAEVTGLSGESDAIREVLVKIEQMAPVSSTVLIEGESGTGKELVARGIHDLSPRRGKAFIAVNCAAIPETLLESELFGHEKGAFTGAAERRLGRFELADGGTIFLDEVGEMPPATQVKLLRVLEDRSFFRVGGTQPIKVDVRVTAATNKSLKAEVALGRFPDDLFYRLNVLSIHLPPLRERRTDIPLLVRRFIAELAALHDRTFRGITPEALQILVDADWPGNVRQLRNLIESMSCSRRRARLRRATSRATSARGVGWGGAGSWCGSPAPREASPARSSSSSSAVLSSSSYKSRSCAAVWRTSLSASRSLKSVRARELAPWRRSRPKSPPRARWCTGPARLWQTLSVLRSSPRCARRRGIAARRPRSSALASARCIASSRSTQ